MDSRLLNVFHDDPFDGSYTQLNTDLWTNENDTMGQLTETLNGILPIAADVVNDTDVYSSTLLATEDNYRISHCLDNTTNLQNKELLIYDDFTQHGDLAADGTIEIITVNPNSLDSDGSGDEDEYDDDDDEDEDDSNDELNVDAAAGGTTNKHNLMDMDYIDYNDDDNQSVFSNATFRTRTDSSSIGDYESHTSDYDDSSADEEENANDIASSINNNNFTKNDNSSKIDAVLLLETDEMPDLAAGLLAADGIDLGVGYELPALEDIAIVGNKNRTLSTNTIGSELDVHNFDLAEFITNDDLTLNVGHVERKPRKSIVKPKINAAPITKRLAAIPVKSVISDDSDSDSDADSDVIVDIETVDTVDMGQGLWKTPKASVETNANTNENDISFEDNVKKDPSWSPKAAKKQQDSGVKEAKTRPSATTTITSNSPNTNNNNNNNNAADISRTFSIVPSKRQCDILKGKSNANKNKITTKQIQGKPITKKGPETTAGNAAKAGSLTCRVGVGQGGKNLSLVAENKNKDAESKQQSKQKDDEKKVEAKKIVKESTTTTTQQQVVANVAQQQQENVKENIKENVKENIKENVKEIIKENELEQKKLAVKRKLNLEEYKQRRGENSSATQNSGTNADTQNTTKTAATIPNTQQVKHSEEVATVVKSLRNQITQKTVNDPITEAKNKVLRMQELKRAQQLKIIDSTISAKVPRVTKLPPLKDIVKDTYYSNNEQQTKASNNSKLHPDYEELIIVSAGSNTDISIPPHNMLPINTCERSLLKSSALLYKLPNVMPSSSSLISSIQGVVVQKVIGPEKPNITNNVKSTVPPPKTTQKHVEQHGEDKVIMHLRKDRIRPSTVSIAIQTDLQPGFEALPKIIPLKRGGGRTTKRNYRKHNDSLNALDECDESDDVSCERSSRNNQNRNRNRNCSRSRSRSPANRSRSRSVDSYASSMERGGGGARQTDTTCGYSSRGTRRHRSSISSSYSESGRVSRNRQRQRRTSYTKRTKRYSRNLSSSSSSSSERSRSRSRSRRRSRSRSRSRGRLRSRSRSRSHSRSRSRSRSPYYRRSYSRSRSRSRSISRATNNRFVKPGAGYKKNANNVSQPAVEERRIVYVGRIEEETTKEMLRRKFLPYGTIKQISIHYKDNGMKYGFVTYERSQDAFTVIDGSARDPTINMYDISFGGRRAFCRSSYADLDNAGINTYHSIVFPKVVAPPKEEDSFEALLQKVKAKMNANKATTSTTTTTA